MRKQGHTKSPDSTPHVGERVNNLFNLVDSNGDGGIDRDEGLDLLKSFGIVAPQDHEMIDDLLKGDTNGDGMLQPEELL